MRWIFTGQLKRRRLVSPSSETSYHIPAKVFLPVGLRSSLTRLLEDADASVELMPIAHAEYLVQNWGESHSEIEPVLDRDDAIAWLRYDESAGALCLVCGYPESLFSEYRALLDEAFFRGLHISASALGTFSSATNNPHSKQPTQDEFECGRPCLTGPVTIELSSEEPA